MKSTIPLSALLAVSSVEAAVVAAEAPIPETRPTPGIEVAPGELMILCPVTGKPLLTGMILNKASFDVIEIDANSVKCPHCFQIHKWNKADVLNPPQ